MVKSDADSWTMVTLSWDMLNQPSWADEVTLNKKNVTKFTWEVKGDMKGTQPKKNFLSVDDVRCVGWSTKPFVPSSSSVARSSSSIVPSSSSVIPSSSSVAPSSYSIAFSSSSVQQSSSSIVRSSSSSSEELPQSSSSEETVTSSSSVLPESSSSAEEPPMCMPVATLDKLGFSYARNTLSILGVRGTINIQVFDLMGHFVKEFVANSLLGEVQFDLNVLPKGNYLVRYTANAVAKTARIAVR